VERRKAWRMLQSKAGVTNKDYLAQRSLLKKVDEGKIAITDLKSRTRELYEAEIASLSKPAAPAAPAPAPKPATAAA